MSIPTALKYRDDITPAQKWLLCILMDEATSDGHLQITRYSLEHSCHLLREPDEIASDLTALVLAKDVELHITKTSDGDVYEMALPILAREAVLVG